VDTHDLKQQLLEEIFKTLGWGAGHPLRSLCSPLFSVACRRFAQIAIRFDHGVAGHGFWAAARRLLPHFVSIKSISRTKFYGE